MNYTTETTFQQFSKRKKQKRERMEGTVSYFLVSPFFRVLSQELNKGTKKKVMAGPPVRTRLCLMLLSTN